MALVLPYPDLDFVPLDILTAEEMNQIVANYTHIANQFPITSQNIDWTTITNQIPWVALNFSRIGLKTLKNVDSLSNFDEGVFVPYIVNGELVATINGTQRTLTGCRAYIIASLGDNAQVFAGLMLITYNSTNQSLSGKLYYRTVHGSFSSAGWREISHL